MKNFKKEIKEWEMIRPADLHVHLCMAQMMRDVVPYTAYGFGAALVIGNTKVPIFNKSDALGYCEEIEKEVMVFDPDFQLLMSVMLTCDTTPEVIREAAQAAKVLKWIPGNTSTNSGSGVSMHDIEEYYPVLQEASIQKMVFCIHAELATDLDGEPIDPKYQEIAAIPVIARIIHDFPGLKIVIEHVSTRAMAELVLNASTKIAATISVHHASLDNSYRFLANGKLNSFYHCKPVLKSGIDQEFIKRLMWNGNPKFFFGSDSAPHALLAKLGDNPASGIFSAPTALPKLFEMFLEADKLDELENFASIFGRRFYGLPIPEKKIRFVKEPWTAAEFIGHENVPVLFGGHTFDWKVIA